MHKRYPVLLLMTMFLLAACGSAEPTPTPIPFARHTAQDVLGALAASGLSVERPMRDMIVGREAPTTFSDRYVFEIASVAPQGGQVLVFDNEAGLQAWEAYIERLRNNSATRRDVVYTYVHNNVLLQLNTNLLPDEANRYKAALEGIQ